MQSFNYCEKSMCSSPALWEVFAIRYMLYRWLSPGVFGNVLVESDASMLVKEISNQICSMSADDFGRD